MSRKIGKIIILTCLIMVLSTVTVSAFLYYSNGYYTAYIEIKDRCSYSEFHSSLSAWNVTPTPAWFKEVVVSNNYMSDDVYTDTWYGLYTPKKLQYVFWGRAQEFTIELNRSMLVDKSSNFKQSVAVHELGHALCLDDNPPESPSIMRYDRDRNTMITPQQDDIDGVNDAY